MASHTPSIDQAVRLTREAIGVSPLGEGLGGVNLITVALSVGVRTGQPALVLRNALQADAISDVWSRVGSFLECVCVIDAATLVDLVVHPDARIRVHAWSALGKYADRRLIERLKVRLAQELPDLRASGSEALARMALRDKAREVAWQGPLSDELVTVGNLLTGMPGGAEHLPLLFSLLDRGFKARREVAARALRAMGQLAADGFFERELVHRWWLPARWSRRPAATPLTDEVLWLLGEWRDPRGITLIAERAQHKTEGVWRAIAKIGGVAAGRALVDFAESGETMQWFTRHPTDRAAASVLLEAFEKRPGFRRTGALMLAGMVGPASAGHLVAALRDPYRAVRRQAETALLRLNGAAAPLLTPLLRDPASDVRSAALRILESMATQAQAGEIADVLIRGSAVERRTAARILGKLGGEVAAGHLNASWSSFDNDTKQAVIRIAAAVMDGHVAEAVMDLAAHDPSALVRRDAGSEFGPWLDHQRWRPLVERLVLALLEDDSEDVAAASIDATADRDGHIAIGLVSLVEAHGTPVQRARMATFQTRAKLLRREVREATAEYPAVAACASGTTSATTPRPVPVPELPAPLTDRVWFSAVCPEIIRAGSAFVLEVWANLQGEGATLRERRPFERWIEKGPVVVPRGACLTVTVEIAAFRIRGLTDTMQWLGVQGNASFGVNVPRDVAPGSYLGTAVVHLGHLRVSTLQFLLEVGRGKCDVRVDVTGEEQRVRTAFASYASEDRERVLARVQGMQAILPDLEIFLDVMSLRMGEVWKERLLKEISLRDAFFLFWSQAARHSKWVDYEWRAAAQIRGTHFIDPVALEDAPPPAELSHLHFGHWTLALANHRGHPLSRTAPAAPD